MKPSIMIAGTHSGSGKTTVSLGLMAVLSEKMRIQPYKTGPDYIDAAYHSVITGRKSRNLDTWILDDNTNRYLFEKNLVDSDMGIIEGVMGYYDGKEMTSMVGSTAYLSQVLGVPTVLVVNGKGMAGSVVPLIKGFLDYDPGNNIKGVIFNQVSASHYQLIKEVVEETLGISVYGYVENIPELSLKERHLGLTPIWEMDDFAEKLSFVKNRLSQTLDWQGLYELGKNRTPVKYSTPHISKHQPIRIGLAYDKAFNFYYEDNIDLLKEMGGEIIPFSPIESTFIPDALDLVILGGGFPEIFAEELENNAAIRKDLNQHLELGLPYLSECGGMMYLCEKLTDLTGRTYQMTGYLKGYTEMTQKLQRFGYATAKMVKECPYGEDQSEIRLHEFHRSRESIQEVKALSLYKTRKGSISKNWECGYIKGNGISHYGHLHYYSQMAWIESVYEKALMHQKTKKG